MDKILRNYLEDNGFDIEFMQNLRGYCNCSECSLIVDLKEELEVFGSNFDIERIDGLNIVYNLSTGEFIHVFDSCIECIDDYSSRLYCRYCDYHGRYEISEEFVTIENTGNTYCTHCEGDAYVECYECGELMEIEESYYNEDDDHYYCIECYDNNFNTSIYVYDYHEFDNYNPIGNPVDGIYYGFEIETASDDRVLDLNKFYRITENEFPNWNNYFHVERDCSISGYEFISNPLSKQVALEILPKMIKLLKKSGFYVDNDCGGHIHITRTDKSKNRLFDMLSFLNNNKRFVTLFSNRDDYSIDRWANFYNLDNDKLKKVANEGYFNGRYKTINLMNRKTFEFRIFKGTLNISRLFANIEFIECLLNEEINGLSDFKDLMEYKDKYSYLCDLIENIEDKL